jgi:hypothetical protein
MIDRSIIALGIVLMGMARIGRMDEEWEDLSFHWVVLSVSIAGSTTAYQIISLCILDSIRRIVNTVVAASHVSTALSGNRRGKNQPSDQDP